MARYSREFKYSMMMKMMPPENQPVGEIAKETGLSEATLYKWKSRLKQKAWWHQVSRDRNVGAQRISSLL